MKFNMKLINVIYKNLWSKEWFTHHKIEEETNNEINSIDDLKNIAPNKEEYESIVLEYKKLAVEKQKEINEYINYEMKELTGLYSEIKETPMMKEVNKKMVEITEKIKQMVEQWEDKYENSDFVKSHTQLALLNVMKQNKKELISSGTTGWLSSGANNQNEWF